MYQFQISIQPLPAERAAGSVIDLDGHRVTTLAVSSQQLGSLAFARSFEDVAADLARLERLFIEPDGSFVWVSSREDVPWQVDGMLYDHQGRVRLVDLKGTCPGDQFDRLLGTLGWPATALMFQSARPAVWLDEAEFRRHAQQQAGA